MDNVAKDLDKERQILKLRIFDLEKTLEGVRKDLKENESYMPSLQHSLKENESYMSSLQTSLKELDNLREIKADIDRKNEQTASILKMQGTQLAELLVLYKEEQSLRKSGYFNDIQGGEIMSPSSMESNLKCYKSRKLLSPSHVNRLTSLPDELLSQILSLLPTKDVAATQVVSKRMRHALSWITSVDLDDSHQVNRFPLFKSFIINVLRKLSESKQRLTRFRLRLGGSKFKTTYFHDGDDCQRNFLPYMEPGRLNMWISYPLSHCGLKELDLSFHVRKHDGYDCKLLPSLFTCQSLEVLRLDSNIEIGDVSEFPCICLPNLKLLHLHSFVFTEDDFVTRLVSSCPALDDLCITHCSWKKLDSLQISSRSLRRLVLTPNCYYDDDREKNSDLVLIKTPGLQYLNYSDNIAYHYSLLHMNALVEAHVDFVLPLQDRSLETSSRCQINLVIQLSNVQHLSLLGYSSENMYFIADGEFKDQVPVFRNLKILELDAFSESSSRWDIALLLMLHNSPLLETLIFPRGVFENIEDIYFHHDSSVAVAAVLEYEGWTTHQITPSCCLTHLKCEDL